MFRPIAFTLTLCLATIMAQASPVSGQGTWETTLQGRAPLTPGGTDYQAYYDTDLNISWLADADYAATNSFGVSGILGLLSNGYAAGSMTWDTAQSWIMAMNNANYLGASNWRLPAVMELGIPPGYCNTGLNFYSGSDCGYNVDPRTGEMAHMYYRTLGNIALYNTSGGYVGCGTSSPYCLTNRGPFSNLLPVAYWSSDYVQTAGFAWYFDFIFGGQGNSGKDAHFYAWAVTDGDAFSAVPIPATAWLLGTALAGLGGRRILRRKVIG